MRFVSTDGKELCGEPVDSEIDGKNASHATHSLRASANNNTVGLAVAAGQRVQVKVLDVSSALIEGRLTGEIATIEKVSLELVVQDRI